MVSARLGDGEVFDSAKLKNTVRFLIENDMRNVVIDLGNLEYLYSDTINAFIASNRHMLEVSGRIAILTEHPKVQDILKRAGLDNIMRIYRSEAEMIADSKEILRQTSSYRIEELQRIAGAPNEPPPVPKTEFDEFRLEMGERLGSKIENNELPQHQLGLPPQQPSGAAPLGQPAGFAPAAAGFPPASAPSAPAPVAGFPAPAASPGFGGAGHFDYPTLQLPIGGLVGAAPSPAGTPGSSAEPALGGPFSPSGPPAGGAGGNLPPFGQDEENYPEARSRKPSQERMRSPSARKPQARRVGGREFPAREGAESPAPGYAAAPSEAEAPAGPFAYPPPGLSSSAASQPSEPASLGPAPSPIPAPPKDEEPSLSPSLNRYRSIEPESRSAGKFIAIGLLVFLLFGAGAYFFLQKDGDPAGETLAEAPTPAPVPEPAAPPAPVDSIPAAVPSAEPAAPPPPPAVRPDRQAAPGNRRPTGREEPRAKSAREPARPRETAPARPPATAAVPAPADPSAPAPGAAEPPAEAARPIPKGSLRVTSNPPGAEVLVNFSKKGVTPLDVKLPNNSNKIIVRLSGYKRFETTVRRNSAENDLAVVLEKEPAPEEVRPEPPKPPVAAAPRPEPSKPAPTAARPSEPAKPAPPAPEPAKPAAKPEPSKPQVVAAPPEPPAEKPKTGPPTPGTGPLGSIFISSSPVKADIIVDGVNTGKKTPSRLELPSGPHRIEIQKGGLSATVDQVVNEGKNKALHLTLQ